MSPKENKGCRTFDHGGDAGIAAWGPRLEDVFEQAFLGLVDYIVAGEKVRPREERKISLEAPDGEGLLVGWLGEALFLIDGEGWLPGRVKVKVGEGPGGLSLEAKVWGEELDPECHWIIRDVKAVTYHGSRLVRQGDAWQARVVLDL
ncbi:MAG: archease [Limnochordia bacterium]|jgi:SHS2 domain-containing protein|nr:archease [Bacillota bacterium]